MANEKSGEANNQTDWWKRFDQNIWRIAKTAWLVALALGGIVAVDIVGNLAIQVFMGLIP